MRRQIAGAMSASPTMVGALTVLVVALAVFLAYNANRGLPFVPSYRLTAQLPNANQLVPGNEVRIGGVRVGIVESIEPRAGEDGSLTARVDLKLDETARPLPADSTVIVRSRSALGLKYLEIAAGESGEALPEGAVLPLSAARPEPVELDQVLNAFDGPTRRAIRVNQRELGDALAGRGPALNEALAQLAPALERLVPVARNLASAGTGLERFVAALAATAAELAPVAEVQARAFVALDATFAALARVARPHIQDAIAESPPTLRAALATLPRTRGFLRHSTRLFAELRPGARALERDAPALAAALGAGPAALRDAPALNRQLDPTAQAVLDFSRDPGVRAGIAGLTEAMGPAGTLLRFVAPAQSVCNYATILFANAASLLSGAAGAGGSAQRFIVFDIPKGPNSEGSPSSAPADGPGKNYLHSNPYPNTAAPGQPRECEAGNEDFAEGRQAIGNVPGSQGTRTAGQSGGGG